MNKPAWGRVALFVAAITWGTAFFIVKNTVDVVPPAMIWAIRYIIGAAALALVFFKHFRGITGKQVLGTVVIGCILGCASVVQTTGLTDTTPGKNAFLTAVYCIIVPFMNWAVRRKRPAGKSFFAAALCLVGIALVSLDGDLAIRYGDWVTLISGFLFAAHIVSVNELGDGIDTMALSSLQFAFASLFCFAAHFVLGESMDLSTVSTQDWLVLLYLGIVPTCIAFTCQVVGQKVVPAEAASLILCLESVFGVLASVLFYGETLTIRLFIGFCVIFCAIVISESNILDKVLTKKKNI